MASHFRGTCCEKQCGGSKHRASSQPCGATSATALTAVGEPVAILEVRVVYRDLTRSESELPESWLLLPVLTEEEFRVLPEDESVARIP